MLRVRVLRLAVLLAALSAVALAVRFEAHPPLSRYAPSSVAVYDAHGQLMRLTLAVDGQYRLWTPLDRVNPEFVDALLLHEDRHFRWHPGVSPTALVRAGLQTLRGSRQGGSTLTMQLARLIYRLNTRTASGKLRQIAAALWLEMRYSKHDILEAHLNLMPFGRNVEGVGAAALIYFGKRADQLTLDEALILVLIPQAPHARTPEGSEPSSLAAARARLASLWLRHHPTSATRPLRSELQYNRLRQLPFEAPHVVTALLAESAPAQEIHTTIDLSLQHLLERRLQQYVIEQRRVGIYNASAMLLDVRDMTVKAAVGSADFFDPAIAGQVNGTLAKRSPGSTLKPLIYALAIDQGLIHEATMLKDAPTAFGAYSPENFDGQFDGPISARDALIRSRNVPAVALAAKLSRPNLYDLLKAAGVSQLASEQHYGLALALGGGDLNMEELVQLYAMLLNYGVWRPVRYRPDTAPSQGFRLLSEDASFMVLDMLRHNPRPDGLADPLPPVGWKSGTSWGFRDAWSVGAVGPYVVAVWVGNFDGSSNPALVGTQMAAPLLFHIIDGLRASVVSMPDLAARVPARARRVEVCAASGDLPNADCPHTVQTWFIPGVSPIRVSTVHQRLLIDLRTGLQACADTPTQFRSSQVFEVWPSDIRRLFARAGMPRRQPPENRCAQSASSGIADPSIVSPRNGVSYALHSQRLGSETITLNAIAAGEIRRVYWFVDEAFVGSADPSTPIGWSPQRSGRFKVSVVDDHGGSATRVIGVALLP